MNRALSAVVLTILLVSTRPTSVGQSDYLHTKPELARYSNTMLMRFYVQLNADKGPYEGCWKPGMSRNIGIAEKSC
jgi:hypothetical protein